MYTVTPNYKDATISITDNSNTLLLHFPIKSYNTYLQVNVKHYVDSKTKEIVLLPDIHNRVITIIDGVSYAQATQYEYDKWMSQIYPDSDNAIIYNKCIQQ